MKLTDIVLDECGRFHAFFGHQPDYLFLGAKQMDEVDAMVAELKRWGMMIDDKTLKGKRAKFHGMEVFRVDAESHLSFGCRQPSPCG